MNHEPFKIRRHMPAFSKVLLNALKNPLLIYFAIAGNFLTFSSAYVFYQVEHLTNPNVNHYIDALWWAMCTVSTVGYGDIVPMTLAGRAVGVFLIVVGVAFFLSSMAILVSIISLAVSHSRLD